MPKIKICAVQFKVEKSFEKNLQKAEKFFRKAKSRKCDIICFPEIFFTGPLNKKAYGQGTADASKRFFSQLSRKYKIHSVMGSIIEKSGNKFYNTSYLFNDKGKTIGNYRKAFLTRSEKKYLTAGNEAKVFKTKIGSIGLQICLDLLHPEVTRQHMKKKADIVFCPSFWSSKSSTYDATYYKYFKNRIPKEVDSLVSARAIENAVIFVYVNAASKFHNQHCSNVLLGRTQIAVPFYGTIIKLNHNKEAVLVKEIDLKIVKDARKIYITS